MHNPCISGPELVLMALHSTPILDAQARPPTATSRYCASSFPQRRGARYEISHGSQGPRRHALLWAQWSLRDGPHRPMGLFAPALVSSRPLSRVRVIDRRPLDGTGRSSVIVAPAAPFWARSTGIGYRTCRKRRRVADRHGRLDRREGRRTVLGTPNSARCIGA